jgi:hypothetical protein
MKTFLIWVSVAGCIISSCAAWKVGPFPPGSPKYCGSDPECPSGEHCGPQTLPDANGVHHFICMDGESSIDSYPDTSPGQ